MLGLNENDELRVNLLFLSLNAMMIGLNIGAERFDKVPISFVLFCWFWWYIEINIKNR